MSYTVSENDDSFEVTMTATADDDLTEEGVAQIQVPLLRSNLSSAWCWSVLVLVEWSGQVNTGLYWSVLVWNDLD